MLFGGQFLECQLVESAAALAGFVVEVVWAFAGFSHVPSTGNQFIGPTSISQSLRQIVLGIGEGAQMESIVHQMVSFLHQFRTWLWPFFTH